MVRLSSTPHFLFWLWAQIGKGEEGLSIWALVEIGKVGYKFIH